MARAKKDGVYLNVRIETPIYKKLQEVCEEEIGRASCRERV